MKKTIIGIAALGLIATLWVSCKKDEQTVSPPDPENEFITTVKLVATNANDPNDVQTASWTDTSLVHDAPPNATSAVLNLHANTTYNVQVQFWDDTKSPAGDVTSEIKDRENYHLICFNVQPGLGLNITRTDSDSNTPPLPVGLTDNFAAGSASTGNLEVELRHQPNVKDGTCDPGSTDADVNFQINIQ